MQPCYGIVVAYFTVLSQHNFTRETGSKFDASFERTTAAKPADDDSAEKSGDGADAHGTQIAINALSTIPVLHYYLIVYMYLLYVLKFTNPVFFSLNRTFLVFQRMKPR